MEADHRSIHGEYDAIVLADILEHTLDPLGEELCGVVLRRTRRLVTPAQLLESVGG